MTDNWKAVHRIMVFEKWGVKDVSSSPCTDVAYWSSQSDCCGFSATLSMFVSDASLTYVFSSPCTAVRGTIAAHEVIVAVFQQRYWRSFRIQFNVLLFLGGSVVGSLFRMVDLHSTQTRVIYTRACKDFSGFHLVLQEWGALLSLFNLLSSLDVACDLSRSFVGSGLSVSGKLNAGLVLSVNACGVFGSQGSSSSGLVQLGSALSV
jgi:hypothetical protein